MPIMQSDTLNVIQAREPGLTVHGKAPAALVRTPIGRTEPRVAYT